MVNELVSAIDIRKIPLSIPIVFITFSSAIDFMCEGMLYWILLKLIDFKWPYCMLSSRVYTRVAVSESPGVGI